MSKDSYLEAAARIERLQRLFSEVIKRELENLKAGDINAVQALLLYNIGGNQLTVGELTNRGYYLGSNVSYNLRKMVENGYVLHTPSKHDRRSSHISLSAKGIALFKKLDQVLGDQALVFKEEFIDSESMNEFCYTLQKLETFWSGTLKHEIS